MSVKNTELPASTAQSSKDVIDRVYQNAEKLKALLEREYQSLIERDVLAINALATEKQQLLDSLSNLEPQLRVVYSALEMQDDENTLEGLLKICNELNARNHSLVLIAIDQNRKSMALLRNILKLDEASVYSAGGELDADDSKRYLGAA